MAKIKNILNSFKRDLTEKFSLIDLYFILMVILLFVAYHPFVQELVRSFASYINKGFDNSLFMKIITLSILLFTIIILAKTFTKKRVSRLSLYISTYSLLFYIYFRWLHQCIEWEYIKHGYFTYFDIIGIVSSTTILLYIKERIKCAFPQEMSYDNSDKLLCDDAITDSNDDILSRTPFAKELAKTIPNCNTNNCAYSIGIVAPWGYGKTSFIKLLTKELEQNENLEIIHFSPWHLSANKDIMSAFFDQLSKHIIVNDIQLFELISKYSNYIIGETRSTALLHSLKEESQPTALYNKISMILSERSKRIVIIIDDIDRLQGKEILEVFKIIRGSANFPNIIFIVAYDKDYVMNSISMLPIYANERFIEKFFQTEYYLPHYSLDKIADYVLQQAKQFMTENDYNIFKDKYIKYDSILYQTKPHEDCIKNLRDAKRWLNAIKLEYNLLKEEVQICDLADIILLKLYFPSIYNIFSIEYKSFLYQNNNVYTFWEEGVDKGDRYFELLNSKKRNFWDCNEIKNSKIDTEKLKNIFDRMLPKNCYQPENKAFNDPFYTPRYFYGMLQNYDIPEKDFEKYIKMDYNDLKQIMSLEFIEQRNIALLKLWRHYKPSNNDERYNVLQMIFYACSNNENLFCSQDVVFNLVNDFTISKTEIAQILKDLMLRNGASYYVCLLINEIKKGYYNWTDFMTLEEFEDIQLESFKNAINENLPIDIIFKFFWLTAKVQYYNEGNDRHSKYIHSPKAVKIFKEGIIENPQKFLYKLIGTESSPTEEIKEWKPYDLISQAWPRWEDFEEFLKTVPDSDKHTEYIDFFNKFKDNNYKAVAYEFKYCK